MPFDNFEVFRASSQRWHTYVTRVLYKKLLHFLHAFEGTTGCVVSRGRQAVLCHGNPLQRQVASGDRNVLGVDLTFSGT